MNRKATEMVTWTGVAIIFLMYGAVVLNLEGFVAANHRTDYGGPALGRPAGDGKITMGAILSQLPAPATTVVIKGTTYWRDGTTYYARVHSGGDIVYKVVPPPV